MGPTGTDLLIFTDSGWPYVINGEGQRCAEFEYTSNMHQDWGGEGWGEGWSVCYDALKQNKQTH